MSEKRLAEMIPIKQYKQLKILKINNQVKLWRER